MTYHILDKRFTYTPACATDITKTFARARARMAQTKLMRHMPEMYAPIPSNMTEVEIAEAYKLMHQDMDADYPWGN